MSADRLIKLSDGVEVPSREVSYVPSLRRQDIVLLRCLNAGTRVMRTHARLQSHMLSNARSSMIHGWQDMLLL